MGVLVVGREELVDSKSRTVTVFGVASLFFVCQVIGQWSRIWICQIIQIAFVFDGSFRIRKILFPFLSCLGGSHRRI